MDEDGGWELGERVGDKCSRDVVLPEHLEAGLSPEQQANDIASFISKISREYLPLHDKNLPHRVVAGLSNSPCCGHPTLQDHEVYELMKARKITGGVDEDLHPVIVKEYLPELAHSVGVVLHEALSVEA